MSWREFLNTPIQSDAIDFLKQIPNGVVHCCVTSSPFYGMRKYDGDQFREWGGDPNCEHEWKPSDPPRTKNAIQGSTETEKNPNVVEIGKMEGGFFCRNCDCWKGPLGGESTPELFIKNLMMIFREVRRVLRDDGSFYPNLGDTFGENKNLLQVPFMLSKALQEDGWILRSVIPWIKMNPVPQSSIDRPPISHEYFFQFVKSPTYFYDQETIKVPTKHPGIQSRGHSKKNQKLGKYKSIEHEAKHRQGFHKGREVIVGKTRSKRTGDFYFDSFNVFYSWFSSYQSHLRDIKEEKCELLLDMEGNPLSLLVNTKPGKEEHYAPYPEKLIEDLIKISSPDKVCSKCRNPALKRIVNKNRGTTITKGFEPNCICNEETIPSIILDPFLGSGTTAVVAEMLGRDWLGCDISQEYIEISKERLKEKKRRRGNVVANCEEGWK